MGHWTKEIPKVEGYYPVLIFRNSQRAIVSLRIIRDDEAQVCDYSVWLLNGGMTASMSKWSAKSVSWWYSEPLPSLPKKSSKEDK